MAMERVHQTIGADVQIQSLGQGADFGFGSHQDRVDQIRAEIANGTYETDDKIDIAVSQLLDEIA